MYNAYVKGSIPDQYCREAEDALAATERSMNDIESVIERILDDLDSVLSDKEELDDQLEELEIERDNWKAKYQEVHAFSSEMITMLTNVMVASDAMSTYCKNKLVLLGAVNESEDPDSDSRAGSDGGLKTILVKNDGKSSA